MVFVFAWFARPFSSPSAVEPGPAPDVRTVSETVESFPDRLSVNPADAAVRVESRVSPAPPDSAKMLRERNFSDGYVSSAPLTVIAAPTLGRPPISSRTSPVVPSSGRPQVQQHSALVAPDAHAGESLRCYQIRKARETINRQGVHRSTQFIRDSLLANARAYTRAGCGR